MGPPGSARLHPPSTSPSANEPANEPAVAPQVEFGAIFRSPKIDRRLKYTLNRLRRGAETHRDFSGVALLEAHPFLSDPDLMAQGAACHRRGPLWFTTTSPLPPASASPSSRSACHVHSPPLCPVRRARVPRWAQLLRRLPPRSPDRCRRRLHRGARVGTSPPDPARARRPQPACVLHLRAVDRLPARVLPRAPPSDALPIRPPRAPAEARPPWHFDFFQLSLPPLAYRSPPFSEVLAATPRSEKLMPLTLTARPLVPPPLHQPSPLPRLLRLPLSARLPPPARAEGAG